MANQPGSMLSSTGNIAADQIEQDALKQPLRFLPGSIDDFCEKVEAICEPGNRSVYTSPVFCYLQARLTGKTRMLQAKKRRLFSLYFSCRSYSPKSMFGGFMSWLAEGRSDRETARVLQDMISLFGQKIIKEKLACDSYSDEQVFVNGFDSLMDTSNAQGLRQPSHSVSQQQESGRLLLAFDDAAELLKKQHVMYLESKRLAVRVNMLRWIRHCVSTEISGNYFWNCPVVFCDSSPEIDKTEPIRNGECEGLLGAEVPRVFMPLILHDSFDLFMDRVAETAFEVNTRMAWLEHVKLGRYLIELAFYGRPIWGAMACSSALEKFDLKSVTSFVNVVYKKAFMMFREKYDFEEILLASKASSSSKRHLFEAAVVLVLGSTFGVFDVHSTNLNLLFAKRCLCELLALDMDGRVCFSAFPSEPLVACQATAMFAQIDATEKVIEAACEYHDMGIITLDNPRVFFIQLHTLLATINSTIIKGVQYNDAVSSTALSVCMPRSARSFLAKVVGDQILDKLTHLNDILNGAVAMSHFATVDMDDMMEELEQLGCPGSNIDRMHYLDNIQLALTIGRLAGRNAAGMVAESWRGIDLMVPVMCSNGQLGCILLAVSSDMDPSKEDTLDRALMEISSADPTMLLAAPHPPPKVALPTIGIFVQKIDGPFSVSFKQLSHAVRVTVSGVHPWLREHLGKECLKTCLSLWLKE